MPSGYTDCACRDCFEIATSDDMANPDMCAECEEAGCEADEECQRSDAYGCDEPSEPEEEDITTADHRRFYQSGKLILALEESDDMWAALHAHMQHTKFFPNVWFISDHGNAHLMTEMTR